MSRKTVLLAIVLLSAMWLTAAGFEVSDLLYVSWGRVPGGTATYTGPTCEVIAEYWFGNHGYSKFWRDINGDGAVDERDAEEVIEEYVEDWTGLGYFDPSFGVHDYELFEEIVFYFGRAYPGEFKVKVYDSSIVQEMIQYKGEGPDDSLYQHLGASVELYGNATRANYVSDLQAGAVVIVGLGNEGGTNIYLVGRSFEEQASGSMWPIGHLDTADDPFRTGFQAHGIDTFWQQGADHWLAQYGSWIPVECMISVLPVSGTIETSGTTGEPDRVTTSTDCSGDTRLTQALTTSGDFTVLESEARNLGGVDLYTYELASTTVSGLCSFSVPNPSGLIAVNLFSDSPCWVLDPTDPSAWKWVFDDVNCSGLGLMQGEKVTFGIEVSSPTTDAQVTGAVEVCSASSSQPSQSPLVEVPDVSGDWVICYDGSCGPITITQNGQDFDGETADLPGYKKYVVSGWIDLNRSYFPAASGWEYPTNVLVTAIPDGPTLPPQASGVPHYPPMMDAGELMAGEAYYPEDPVDPCKMWGFGLNLANLGQFSRPPGLRTAGPCALPSIIVDEPDRSTHPFVTCAPEGDTDPPVQPATDCGVSPQSILFTAITVGNTSGPRTITVTNNGNTPISGSFSLSGDTADFELDSCPSYLLYPGQSETCKVRFAPQNEGMREAYVSVGSASDGCPDVRLRGRAEEVATCPDLVITDLWGCTIDPGQNEGSVKIQGWIKNQGSTDATDVRLVIYFSWNGSFFPMVIDRDIGEIKEGWKRSFDVTVFPVDVATESPFEIDAYVSCTETECDENNNNRWVQIGAGEICD